VWGERGAREKRDGREGIKKRMRKSGKAGVTMGENGGASKKGRRL